MRFALPRRLRGLLAASLVVTALTTGCAAEDVPGAAGGSGGGGDGTFPVTLRTEFGDVTIPKRPQRVVALGWSDAETALALGVEPVGAADWLGVGGDGLGPWVNAEYTRPPAMLGTLEVNMEAVAGLRPDLILDTRSDGTRERYERLSELGVPVVGIPPGAKAYLTPWEKQLELVGKALGRSAEADRLRSDLEARFAQVRKEHPEFAGKHVVAGVRSADSYAAYVDGDGRVEFLKRLGFVNSPKIQRLAAKDQFTVTVSNERMDLLDGDLTLMFLIGRSPEEVTGDPLYQAVPSVRAGRSVLLSDKAVSDALSSASVPGMTYALDKVVPQFAEALAE
ncbi:iron-siderophore ABC transporter substrate-binding protein [Thermomonospora cellulosilytica]|uniref:Iron complex transport system substrate-binding protein n=1 Tax=Thermomonospora cellulosilytica TaxID=1411118 RepID=A0A7W3R966_9ACTN|nr:iron-siderophore ABC transporter substrate-binding protein [Thermomonospora cellulosilytica]MBA9004035.1 iron complex transport system substrate-binding protein [Thermomonospora cellulosilytica]